MCAKPGSVWKRAAQARVERALEPATRAEVVAAAGRAVPPDDFALVLMLDGWLARERGVQWGLKPAQQAAERVAWREMKTGVVFRLEQRAQTQSGRRMLLEKFFEVWRGEPFEFGRRMHALALRKGLHQARRVYVVSDGAAWIWNIVTDRLQPAVELLDFYHAGQHLWTVAQELYPADEARARKWVEPLLHQLRHGGQEQVRRRLEQTLTRLTRSGAAARTVVERERNYFETHRERLDYEQTAAAGAPIGSGAVESACAQLQRRLKGPGMFWSVEGKNQLLALDLARRNGTWDDDFWFEAA